jgi:hypothetical protein
MTTRIAGKGACCIPVTAATLFAGGEMGSLLNPEGHSVVITRATLYTTTPATTGGTNIAIGTAAAATTEGTNIHNEKDADDTAGTAVNCLAYQDASAHLVVWTAAQYVTCTGSTDTVGFTGKLYLEYLHV